MKEKHILGLPLEYQQLPQYFDVHNINESTELKNAFIENLLSAHGTKTILDMTCGTGSQVFYLAKRGYQVIGADFSPALIEQARKKSLAEGMNLTFIDGDMRTLRAGQFDAVITIFNAIGHLTQSDFEISLNNIRSNLKDGGIYIFDIFNLQAITDDMICSFNMDIENVVNGVRIRNTQYSEIDRVNGLLTSHDRYYIFKNGSEPEILDNTFSLQIYTMQQLQCILARNGFQITATYDLEGNHFVVEKSLNIVIVAKKIV